MAIGGYDHDRLKIDGELISIVTGSAQDETNKANARRLAACWNACEGVSTDDIEAVSRNTGPLLANKLAEVDTLRIMAIQRDELLAALEALQDAARPVSNVAYNLGQSDDQWKTSIYPSIKQLDTARGAAHAAIVNAKATGPTIAELQEGGHLPKPESKGAEDAARRVSACLAACSGMTTKALEAMPHPFSNLLSQEFQDVVNHRDQMVASLQKYQEAFDNLFAQCCSNPIKNAWGKQVDMTLLNEAQMLAGRTLKQVPTEPRFTSITKGGTYERLGAIRGAGQLKGVAGIAYRDVKTGGLFIRTPECFAARMKVIEQGEGGAA